MRYVMWLPLAAMLCLFVYAASYGRFDPQDVAACLDVGGLSLETCNAMADWAAKHAE